MIYPEWKRKKGFSRQRQEYRQSKYDSFPKEESGRERAVLEEPISIPAKILVSNRINRVGKSFLKALSR